MGKGSTFGGIGQQMGGGGYGAPQPMGGKGGYAPPSTRNVAAPNTTEPNAPQFMGGKGGYAPTSTRSNTFQPAVEQTPMGMYQRGFMGMMDGMYGGPQRGFNPMMARQAQPEVANQSGTPPAPAPSQTAAPNPLFDSSTTQAEFDRARGITPAVMPSPDMQRQYAQAGEDYRNVTQDQILARQQGVRLSPEQREAINQKNMMKQQQMMQMMQQPQFMGGTGTGLGALSRQFGGNRMGGPRYVGGGYGGGYGYSPFYGPSYGGFSPFARDELRYMYKDGGEVK